MGTSESVNCYNRVAYMEEDTVEIEIPGELGDDGDGWCAPEVRPSEVGETEVEEDAVLISTADLSLESKVNDSVPAEKQVRFLGAVDFEDDSLSIDEYAVAGSGGGKETFTTGDEIVKSRKYDLSITYDNFYKTPRIWLFGFDENGSVLRQEQLFEDIMGDYARKTVTFESHPHDSRPQATVHPCQHANTMLHLINSMSNSGKTPTVDQYMFIFLKFVQSVIPTIEYDFTSDVDTGN